VDLRRTIFFAHPAEKAGIDSGDAFFDLVFQSEHHFSEEFTGDDFIAQRTKGSACPAMVTSLGVEFLGFFYMCGQSR
jgi:hypothetical protein